MAAGLGLPNSEVWLVPYDEAWPALFADEAQRIQAVCGPELLEIVHVGSTAVPGLAAKPIIDIMPGLSRLAEADALREPLQSLGYECLGDYGVPGRVFYRKPECATHHLQVTECHSAFWEDEILFRDILRADAAVARSYQNLKERLATEHRFDRPAYTRGKAGFVLAALRRARATLEPA